MSNFSYNGVSIDVCVNNCRREEKHFDVHFRRFRSSRLISKDRKDDASNERGIGWKRSFITRKSQHFPV